MNSIILKGRAKINLTLDVVGKRENGYHDLEMIMQSINLYDTIYIRKTKVSGVRLKSNYSWLPTNEKNIAYKAAELFFEETGIAGGVAIEITKHIPVAAGLAGGSTDAAATLVGLNRLYETHFSKEKLMEMGLKLGADVPFCIARGTMLAEGIGEKLTPLTPMPTTHVVLVKPPFSASTAMVYGNLDIHNIKQHPDTKLVMAALGEGDVKKVAKNMSNVLEEVTISMYPEITKIKEEFMKCGAMGTMMSGSGSTVFGLFETEEAARKASKHFKTKHDMREVYITTTFNSNSIDRKHDKKHREGLKKRGVKRC